MVGRHFWPGQAFRSRRPAVRDRRRPGPARRSRPDQSGLGLRTVRAVGRRPRPPSPTGIVGWLEGALRLGPNWEPTILGVTIPSPFLPGDRRSRRSSSAGSCSGRSSRRGSSGDRREHHLLDLPWEAPVRLAIGSGGADAVHRPDPGRRRTTCWRCFLNVDVEGAHGGLPRSSLIVGPLVVGSGRLPAGRSRSAPGPAGRWVRRRVGHPANGDGGFEEIDREPRPASRLRASSPCLVALVVAGCLPDVGHRPGPRRERPVERLPRRPRSPWPRSSGA